MVENNLASAARLRFADLGTRLVSGLVLVAAALISLLVGGTLFVLFWLAASVAVLWEWQRMIGHERAVVRVIGGGAALCLAAALSAQLDHDLAGAAVLAGALCVGILARAGMRIWAGTGVLYAGVLILAVLTIRPPVSGPFEGPFAVRAVVWLFAVVWTTDIAAYFAGRYIGGPKVWPAVSPGKTWSGTLVGIVSGAVAGVVVGSVRSALPVSIAPLFLVGLVVALVAQAGDFFESAVKRRFDLKDSSHLIPGHGGVMDRLDGFIAAGGLLVLLWLLRDSSTVGEAIFRW